MTERLRCAACRQVVEHYSDPITGTVYDACDCGTRPVPRLVPAAPVLECKDCRRLRQRLEAIVTAVAALEAEGVEPTGRAVAKRLGWPYPTCVAWLRRARGAGLLPHRDATCRARSSRKSL